MSFVFPECNSLGLAMLRPKRLGDALIAVREGQADTVVILENDLYRRAERGVVEAFFDAARTVVVLDHLENETTAKADVVMAAAPFAQSDGTLVNNEGRAQRFFKVFLPPPGVKESWRWLGDVAAAAGREPGRLSRFDDAVAVAAEAAPVLAGIREAAPGADFRLHGLKVARQSGRWSGRTANLADIDVNEPKPPDDPDSPLAFSMQGTGLTPPPALIPRFWSAGWNSVQAVDKYQTFSGGPLRGGDPGKRLVRPEGDMPPVMSGAGPPREAGPGPGIELAAAYQVFGSEELSTRSPGVASLVPEPGILFHPDDASSLGVAAGNLVELQVGSETVTLTARVGPGVAKGVAAVSAGLPGLAGLALPGWGIIKAVRG